ncbi:hypothetical protein KIN20_015675 [Parelaphostrongylus tenuis]|uniref:Uncharacterized protein n=1 Tax=Parelaphostrongylus tenuis TaxID=148309 RepID=A0AAD5QME8_PARTN|nr:hypothetical protein KIN20_015675 [Parelaphostrongylus tenuis]
MDAESSLRRSLRRINPFHNKLFRLPATPRLARNRKVGNGEDVTTEWNFERTAFRRADERLNGFTSPIITTGLTPTVQRLTNGPPDPQEAELDIHHHVQNLLMQSNRQINHLSKLPSTSYRADGQITDAYWMNEVPFDSRSNNSTISLLKHVNAIRKRHMSKWNRQALDSFLSVLILSFLSLYFFTIPMHSSILLS